MNTPYHGVTAYKQENRGQRPLMPHKVGHLDKNIEQDFPLR